MPPAPEAPQRLGPPAEHLPYPVDIPEAIHRDSPWASTAVMPPAPPAPPFMAAPPPIAPAAPPPRRRTWLMMALAVATVVAVVVGLFVWAPWQSSAPKAPGQPTGLRATSTAQTATLHWIAPTSGAKVDRYLILRNGTQVGTVAGTGTSFVDKGLRPGVTYRYTVVASAGTKRSPASAPVTAATATPSPVNFRQASATATSVTVQWSPPPASPAPDKYVIVVGGTSEAIGSVPGTQTTYQWTGLDPGTGYLIQVVAYWGQNHSAASTALTATTSNPPVSAARLSGSMPLRIKILTSGGGTLKTGLTWPDTWTFTPKCASGPCAVELAGTLTPPGVTVGSFTLTLNRSGAVYKGTTTAQITRCGKEPVIVPVQNTVTVRITAKSADGTSGDWLVTGWTGSLRMQSPYTLAGQYYCPAQTVTASLASTG